MNQKTSSTSGKTIHIVGSRGNMGRRYSAILDHLGVRHTGHDLYDDRLDNLKDADAFIIASPTDCHIRHIKELMHFNKPILCEKPLTTKREDLPFLDFIHSLESTFKKLTMVNQYAYFEHRGEGESYYKYFKSGSDGLYWDCINIIGLASGKVSVSNKSPMWQCQINGHKIMLSDMDNAYIDMVAGWVAFPKANIGYARDAHLKVFKLMEENDAKNTNRGSG